MNDSRDPNRRWLRDRLARVQLARDNTTLRSRRSMERRYRQSRPGSRNCAGVLPPADIAGALAAYQQAQLAAPGDGQVDRELLH